MSSPTGFFDFLYMGIFIILSPVLDRRFYEHTNPPSTLCNKVSSAMWHFHSILNMFSKSFIIVLEGEPVAHSYILNRMLGEFGAAVMVFAKSFDNDDEDWNTSPWMIQGIETVLQDSYKVVMPYFLHFLERGHKDFLWTGPSLQIFPCSESLDAIMPLLTTGKLLDFPTHPIYQLEAVSMQIVQIWRWSS
jgi:hypothetical protein